MEKSTWLSTKNSSWQNLERNLFRLLNGVKVLSFDNLAIEQLRVKEKISPETWEEFYAGDDGTFTYYIDMVNRQFARSSTAPFNKRYPLLDSVDDMFDVIKNGKGDMHV